MYKEKEKLKSKVHSTKFIVFEGINFSGKSTSVNILYNKLRNCYRNVKKISFPDQESQFSKLGTSNLKPGLASKILDMDLAITISNLEKLKNEEHDFVLIDCYILSTIAYFIWKNLCNDKYLNVLYKLFVNVSNPVCSELSYLVNHSPLLKKFYTYQLANKMIEEFMEVIKFLVERNAMFKVDHLFYYDVNYKTIKERIEKKKKTEKLDIFEEMLLDETQYDLLKYIHDVIIKDYSQYLCFHFHNIVNNEKSEEYLSDIILDSEFEVIELKNSSCEELNLLCLDFV